jgi:protein arginine N-methyltransferase 1
MEFMKTQARLLQAIFDWLKNTVFANRALRNLVYDVQNIGEFTSLLEHEKMLADESRVTSYFRAIQRTVQPGQVVLDLGTGSGILAFFAAQKKPRTIYAIDHSNFIEVARQIAEHHHIQNIVFVRQNSRQFTPPEPVDVIIHEQMGDTLFNENMVENLLDLKKRALKPGGKILPGKFNLYLEPACLREDYKTPFLWENRSYGIDFTFLKNTGGTKRLWVRWRTGKRLVSLRGASAPKQSIYSLPTRRLLRRLWRLAMTQNGVFRPQRHLSRHWPNEHPSTAHT